MSITFKCKMCGGDLELTEGSTTCECEYCGTNQTVPSADNEKKMNLFNRANRLRFASEFDKATGVYESIVSEFPEEAEAYWGLCLCKYGIEYVDDPSTGKKIPTCHRTSFESIFNDSNFEMALEYSDLVAQRVYREEAKEIDRLQKAILDIAKSESPYDVFICYKETASDGQRTKDSVMAQDIYDALTDKGYKVFFARITLEDKLGQEYEPYIFSALTSAKVMLAIGTDYEYFNAVWVKNEWSRFLDMMKSDKSKTLIPCYADIDAYDMPQEFKNLQGQDMGKVGFIQDLVRGIGKIIPKGEAAVSAAPVQTVVQQVVSGANVESLLKRAFMFLKDEEWEKADEYCEKVLDANPECAEAYLCKLLAQFKFTSKEQLKESNLPFNSNKYYKKLLEFGDDALKNEISSYNEEINQREDQCEKNILTAEDIPPYSSEYSVPNYIRKIDTKAFTSCYGLENIYVNEYNDFYTSVDGVLFNKDCTHIVWYPSHRKQDSFTIPEGVTSIGDYAFNDCSSLTEITIPESVTSIGKYAFSGCESLTEITIPESVTSIGDYAFYCSSLTNITIPEGVTSIGDRTFDACGSLTSISVNDKNSCFKSIDGVLYTNDLSRIIKYPLQKTNATHAFLIPDGVTSIGKYAFEDCTSLTNITIPNSVTSIGDSAFDGCKSLTEITIPESVTSIGDNAFYGCGSLTDISVDNQNTYYTNIDGVLFTKDHSRIIRYPSEKKNATHVYIIPDGVTNIGESAFEGCKYLTNITIPESVTSIGDSAFAWCKSLTEITIPESVTSLGDYTFSNCKSLRKITIPEGVTSIGESAFDWCESLTEITIPESVTSIGDSAFAWCKSLTEITIPESVTSIGEHAFWGCESLTEITIPESVTSIGEDAFNGCESLTEINIPESVTSIGKRAFCVCKSLTEITIPESVTSIGEHAFSECKSLINITTPEEFIDQIKKDFPEADICTHEQRKRQQEQERQLLERQQEQERQLLERQKEQERQELEHQKRLLEDKKKSLTEEYHMNIQRLSDLEKEKNTVAAELAEIKGIFSGLKRKKTQERLTEIENRIAKLNSRNPEIEQELRKIDAKLSKLESE